jgi:hypothetical protein
MFGLLLRKKKARPAGPPRRTRLGLETLEGREVPSSVTLNVTYGQGRSITLSGTLSGAPNVANQPISIQGQASGRATTDSSGNYTITLTASGLGQVTATDADGSSNIATANLTDTAPVLLTFGGSEGSTEWTFSGTTSYGRYYSDLTVNFSGSVQSMQGKSTTVAGDGSFAYLIELNGTATDNGTVYVKVVDAWGLVSNQLSTNVFQTPP